MFHIDMSDLKYLFSAADLNRGVEYYRQGRVQDLREEVRHGISCVTCEVEGTETYSVSFREVRHGQLHAECSCPRFESVGICKHVAAAMVAYIKRPTKELLPTSDFYARKLLESYMRQHDLHEVQSTPAQLIPKLVQSFYSYSKYPSLSFRVGQEKLYVVRNIRNFLTSVHEGETVALGKNVTLDHSIENFDSRSADLIRLLMNEYPEYRSQDRCSGYAPTDYRKNEITLTGDAFDRFFDLMNGQPVDADVGSVSFSCRDPHITVQLRKKGKHAILSAKPKGRFRFFGNNRSLYAQSESELLRCSEVFRKQLYPLLSDGQPEMKLSFGDMPTFCSCVLPVIEEYVSIEDPDALLQEYLPEECESRFYFDMENECITVKLAFCYGETELAAGTAVENTPTIRRNLRKENQSFSLAQRYFNTETTPYSLSEQEAVYTFLTEHLDKFREHGEVFVSERLQRRRISPSRTTVGISVSDGMLSLNLDTGDFPPHELEALYQSMLKRKKYHRLEDGRFLPLGDTPYEALAEMAHMLQLSPKELSKNELKLPAFRALYLDSLLAKNDALNVTRDRQFRQMIRSFKAVEESDFSLPSALEAVLRPYQKTGFRWLKTLESSGFGGILADEMGLGKTLQVISYLASLERRETKAPCLVVCPTSLILNWGEEFAKFAPELTFSLIMGNAAERKHLISQSAEQDVWVTSYELLRQDISLYENLEFYACILDEAQQIKNQSTLISKAVKTINCRQRFILTGTPIENRLSELWNLFDFLMPGYLFSHRTFVEKLEKPIVKSKNAEASLQLRKLVQPFLLRRLKQDVLKELPPKIEHIRRIPLSETEQRTYFSAVHALKNSLAGTDKLQILAALTQLRRICCDPNLCFENYKGETSKLEACLELCSTMVANGHQILLFSQFTSMLDILRARLDEMGISSFTLQGSTPKEQRAKLVKEFNRGEASVFLISLKAGGTGLNLTSADVVIHYDPWWNQAAQNQATDRAHRIGQTACVHVYKLIAQNTIEEKIMELQQQKATLLDMISQDTDGGILQMSKEDLLRLLEP